MDTVMYNRNKIMLVLNTVAFLVNRRLASEIHRS